MQNALATAPLSAPSSLVRVSVGDLSEVCSAEDMFERGDALVVKAGLPAGTRPTFEPVATDDAAAPAAPAPTALVAAPAPKPPVVVPLPSALTAVSAEGAARSLDDLTAAVAAGFSPKKPLFARGTRVVELGVENARRARVEWEAMPLVGDYCAALVDEVRAEERKDEPALVREVSMLPNGQLAVPGLAPHTITPNALSSFAARAGYAGGSYLARCDAALRAHNVNTWRDRIASTEDAEHEVRVNAAMVAEREAPDFSPAQVVLRTRKAGDGRGVFGVVSPGYAPFDVDLIAEALRLAVHPEARGTVDYDGEKARFRVLFHSNVRPEDYVAGEFFQAGVIIDTSDTAGGSLRGSAMVLQNLCLNLIILDEARRPVFALRHIGSVDKLAAAFRKGFAEAEGKIAHFITKWGFACHEDVLARAAEVARAEGHDDGYVPMKVSEALPGLFGAIIDRELVPVFARKDVAVPKLIEAFNFDQSGAKSVVEVSRASVANAFTRYAHTNDLGSPWAEDEVERAVGAMILGKGTKVPAPLPWAPYAG